MLGISWGGHLNGGKRFLRRHVSMWTPRSEFFLGLSSLSRWNALDRRSLPGYCNLLCSLWGLATAGESRRTRILRLGARSAGDHDTRRGQARPRLQRGQTALRGEATKGKRSSPAGRRSNKPKGFDEALPRKRGGSTAGCRTRGLGCAVVPPCLPSEHVTCLGAR